MIQGEVTASGNSNLIFVSFTTLIALTIKNVYNIGTSKGHRCNGF